MVNSEIPSFLEAPDLNGNLAKTKLYIAVEIGKRLYANGLTEFAELAALSVAEADVPFKDCDKHYSQLLNRTGAKLPELFLNCVAIEHILKEFGELEKQSLDYFAAVAARFLNVIDALPPTSQTAARAVESLLDHSFLRGPLWREARHAWFQLVSDVQHLLQSLMAKDVLSVEDLGKVDLKDCESRLASASSFMLACFSNAQSIYEMWMARCKTFSANAIKTDEELLVRRARDFIHLREQTLRNAASDASQLRLSLARSDIFARNFVGFAEVIDAQIQECRKMLKQFLELDAKALVVPLKENTLTTEALLYVQHLSEHLKALGESHESVDKLKEQLFKYALKCKVPCADILDEEMLQLVPTLRKESVTRAKLEVRLNETSYPLSVAHKEWVLRTIKAAVPTLPYGKGN